ncbi:MULTISPECIES: MFS transporter [unclassified Pseudomonas]|uniref:MFS transporter n=1 Tax=unclassified Pseudomonas TaxID=196821 RepID=UPI000C8693A7|nr:MULTISPECIES: MFS transporter [unclassified Pseudomonas]PMV25225.1 MFS transporter [Pseudomonas sp. FW305-3-2-15-C-TSA2]PMV28947.1 MFS transporter [Pseudomonas sp. DP16D-L5]PMV38942.1 MFS transporter [Pseudomonas sp. FW305-3-2-15-A-LB2]PMV40977.1 MFS transporter [Pseudomonas sp. FW305-3-2-15-C-R2A1]PMV50121.1 MFS transporter [Pseudomonas sp. GW460-4]
MSNDPQLTPSTRNSRLIIFARGISDFGSFLNMVALSTYVYWLSESVVFVSIFLACRVTGGIVGSLFGIPFFRRFAGRGTLAGLDLSRALLLMPLLVLIPAHQLILLPFIAFGIGLCNSLFAIGLNSQMPTWVALEQRVSTNAWITSAAATGAVFGSLLSGLLIAAGGFEAVFAVNIVTYVVAASLIQPLRALYSAAVATHRALSAEWHELRKGLCGAPVLAAMLLISMLDTLGSAAHNVGWPVLSQYISPDTAKTVMGYLLAVWACGKFIGARLASTILKGRGTHSMERLFIVGVALMSSGFILTFQQTELWVALVLVVWAGLGDGLSEVALVSRAQSEPDSLRLPLFSLLTLIQMAGFGVGMLVAGPFYLVWTPAQVIVLFHSLPLTALVVMAIWMKRRA